ncbi:hypothetical protein ENSA5_58250 [Enhygromyxa salina]|uniref:Uncharacterized protein n=1 Tax=Enhygromyxa salina TaxID=215803 RepID=A0A2S9XDZ3_9BACT|nr:hypothetical protein [Enhygromyxa salina]PRP91088.1 hypothetical protein ENSA5_58250 [Enhygromyxa salina]
MPRPFHVLFGVALLAACGPKTGEETSTTFVSTADSGPTTGGDGDGDTGDGNTGDGDAGDGDAGDSETGDGDSGDGDTEGPKFDTIVEADVSMMECIDCALTIDSMQSGVFNISGDDVFATATLMNEIVYALGTYGNGRFIASADSSLPFNEITDCPLHAWLGATEAEPSIFWFGWTPSDGPVNFDIDATVAGVHMPAQYIGNPAQLAAEFDIVMYMEASGQFDQGDEPSDAEMQTLLDYVSIHGGGLYMVSEFSNGSAYLNQDDLDSINRVMQPMGVEALMVSLAWGNVDGNIEFDCFPAPVG